MLIRFKIILILFTLSFLFSEEVESKIDVVKNDVEILPDASLKDLDNKKVNIYKYLDSKPALISFWFLACEPCKKEMKYLDEYNKKYQDSGFKVISINTDNSRALNSVEPFVNSKKYSFKVLSDPRSQYMRKLKGASCPYTVLVDHNGNIFSRHVGYNPGDEIKLEEEILTMLENYEKTKQENTDSLQQPPEDK